MLARIIIFAVALLCSSLAAAQTYPNHSAIIGAGPGVKSFKTAGPCPTNQSLIWSGGTGADPTCGSPALGSLVIGTTAISGGITPQILYVGAGLVLQQEAVVPAAQGGTGVNNGTNTLTLGGPLTTTGVGSVTFALPATTATFTYPSSSDTLAGFASVNNFTNTNTFSGTFNCTGTCQLSGTPFGTFATQNYATPPIIGGVTPNSAQFTTLNLTVTPLALAYGGTAANSAPTARASLVIDQLARPGDANFSITTTTRTVAHTALSAARTDTLPLAASVNAGQTITIVDAYGVATVSNTITALRSGSDLVNGGNSAVVINSQYGGATLTSDGISNWSFVPAGSGGGSGTVTSISCAKGTVCNTITTSGTVTAPGALFDLASALGAL